MFEMKMGRKNETKTCYRFEHRAGGELTTLYLKKADATNAGIDPKNGITVIIKEDNENG